MVELVVGNTYRTRDGEHTVKIIRTLYDVHDDPPYPYEGRDENGHHDCYTIDGLVWRDKYSDDDLIQELSAPVTIVDERIDELDQCTCLCNDLYHQVALAYIKSAGNQANVGEQLAINAHNTARAYINILEHRKQKGTLLTVPVEPWCPPPWSLDA
jgi:hypothetical protein